jgi:archaellum component FlaC
MNNLTWSGNNPTKKTETRKDENKAKKKVDFKKELLDLEKVLERVKEKYELRPTNPVSSAIVNLNSSIEGLKKEVENMKYLDGKGSDN